jgi:hypothetical protein
MSFFDIFIFRQLKALIFVSKYRDRAIVLSEVETVK